MTQVLVEALVDGGERLQCPILTCRAGKSNTKHKYKEVKKNIRKYKQRVQNRRTQKK